MKLHPDQLSRTITSDTLDASAVDESQNTRHILGQSRASEALEFGIGINQPGYNLYIAGEPGSGRTHYINEYLKPLARNGKTPADWLYVNNFETPSEPRCISLPHGQGNKLLRDMDHLIEELLASFPAVFENPAYIQQRTALQNIFNNRYDEALGIVEKSATKRNIAVYRENGVISFGLIVDDQLADDAYFSKLDEKQREQFHQDVIQLEQLLNETLAELPAWQRDLNNQLRQILQQTIKQALKPLFEELLKRYQGHAGVQIYLGQMQKHLPRVIEEHFSGGAEDSKEHPANQRKLLEYLYRPNLISRFSEQKGLPIIHENNPSYSNLFGRISFSASFGEAHINYQHIVAGAVHHANGGYLILDSEKLLSDGRSWATLKRVLREGMLSLDSQNIESNHGMPCNLKPQAIPVSLKVILIGSREIYYALAEADEEFHEQFRVLVDFDSSFELTANNLHQLASLIEKRCQENHSAELSGDAITRLAEFACRIAEHQNRLSTRINLLMDIVTEADYWRDNTSEPLIDKTHIERAIAAKEQRHGRLRDNIINDILTGFINIETSGKALGQVNGLAVLSSGDTGFGCPLRITATAHPGSKGVVDIEREVNLGQAVHSKGVLILSGYLCGRYAKSFALAMSANIAIEQSYGFIDGDSASLAELCALLSSLTGIPLRQDIALTGSVSQFGEVQTVGGVNEKIEGFFDICQARGLTGSQAVLIPAANRDNLMLSQRVIDAVRDGLFAVYCIHHVDEAMELLTDREAGKQLSEGNFTKGSINQLIVEQLMAFSRAANSNDN